MPIPTIPPMTTPVPSRADRLNFRARADVTLGEIPPRVDAINVAIAGINAAAASTEADAASAAQSALTALGAAAFKGQWSALAGPLNIPAAVAHNGVVYILLANTADVTAIVPGVSAQWLAAFSVPMYRLPIFQANVGYAAASAMEVLGAADADSLLGTGPGYLAYTGSLYVAIQGGGGGVASCASSPDLDTWTLRAMPSSQPWGGLGSDGAGNLVAVVQGSTPVAVSSNHGVTWSAGTAFGGAIDGTTAGVHRVGGLWVVPQGTNNQYYTNPDGVSAWTARNLPASAATTSEFRVIGGGAALWFRQAGSTTAYKTVDGINWTTHAASVPAAGMVTGVYPDGSLWGVVGTQLYRSTDGIAWTLQSVQSQVSGALPAEVSGVKTILSGSTIYTHDQGVWSARAKGLITAVDLPNQWAPNIFRSRGHANGNFVQLAHVAGRVVSIKGGASGATGLYTRT